MSNRERDRYEREISKLSEETKEVKSAYSTLLASFHEQGIVGDPYRHTM